MPKESIGELLLSKIKKDDSMVVYLEKKVGLSVSALGKKVQGAHRDPVLIH